MTDEPIPQEELARARRRLCRRVACAVMGAMAGTDTGFEAIATRLGTPEGTIRGWVAKLMDGESIKLDHVSEMMTSMWCELDWRLIQAVPLPAAPAQAQEAE